jgi:hypothetical protein
MLCFLLLLSFFFFFFFLFAFLASRPQMWREWLMATRNPADAAGRMLTFVWVGLFSNFLTYGLRVSVGWAVGWLFGWLGGGWVVVVRLEQACGGVPKRHARHPLRATPGGRHQHRPARQPHVRARVSRANAVFASCVLESAPPPGLHSRARRAPDRAEAGQRVPSLTLCACALLLPSRTAVASLRHAASSSWW